MIVMAATELLQDALMMNLHAVTVHVFLVHGNVITTMIVQTDLMKQTVLLKAALTINLIVVMVTAFMEHGHVMAMVTVQTALMKLSVLLHHVKTKVYGIVVMVNVSQHLMYATAQLISVTQAGLLTVLMVQMKA